MGVERVDYYSDEEYQQALQEEQRELQQQPEPEIVPCFLCGGQMYLSSDNPEENICEECEK